MYIVEHQLAVADATKEDELIAKFLQEEEDALARRSCMCLYTYTLCLFVYLNTIYRIYFREIFSGGRYGS